MLSLPPCPKVMLVCVVSLWGSVNSSVFSGLQSWGPWLHVGIKTAFCKVATPMEPNWLIRKLYHVSFFISTTRYKIS